MRIVFKIYGVLFLCSWTAIATSLEGLSAIYQAFSGGTWNRTRWLTDASSCTWAGVRCDDLLQPTDVVVLNLGDQSMQGSIPSQVGLLTDLTELTIPSAALSSTLPSELGLLETLETVSLQSNFLTGTLPVELRGLSTLAALRLDRNSFCGDFPANVTAGETNTTGNYFGTPCCAVTPALPNVDPCPSPSPTGAPSRSVSPTPLPTTSKDADALAALYASAAGSSWTSKLHWGETSHPCDSDAGVWYGVTCAPTPTPGSGTRLAVAELSLGHNGLAGSVPDEVFSGDQGLGASLSRLSLPGNALTGGLPSQVGVLTLLDTLDLGENPNFADGASGFGRGVGVPSQVGLLTALTNLDLSDGSLQGTIPTQLGKLTALLFADLDTNSFTGTLPREIGGNGTSSLRSLRVESNLLTGSIPPQLGFLTGLTYLQLQDNAGMCGLVPAAVEDLFSGPDVLLSALNYANTGVGVECPVPSPLPSPRPTATYAPSWPPTLDPSSSFPTLLPSVSPSATRAPTDPPTTPPTDSPTDQPTLSPTPVSFQQSGRGRWSEVEPLASWAFTREDCFRGSFPNDIMPGDGGKGVFGSILRNGSLDGRGGETQLTACLDGNGVRVLPDLPQDTGIALASSGTLGALVEQAPLEGITFEVWGQFNKTDDLDTKGSNEPYDDFRPLLMFASDNAKDDYRVDELACDDDPLFDLALWSVHTRLAAAAPKVNDVTDDDELCIYNYYTAVEFRPTNHVVTVFNGTNLTMYLDGVMVLHLNGFLDDGFTPTADIARRSLQFHPWYRLQLLSGPATLQDSLQPFAASLYFVAVYGEALGPDAVLANFNAGVANSRPVVFSANATVPEDGEAACGSDLPLHPERYLSPVSPVSALFTVWLQVYDQDNDPAHPNYRWELAHDYPTTVRITKLPTHGTLYHALSEGGGELRAITAAGTVLWTGAHAATNFSVPVHYRPIKDEHSRQAGDSEGDLAPFDEFSFDAIDGVSGLASQGSSPGSSGSFDDDDDDDDSGSAVVTVFVSPCNDPPRARNVTLATTSATLTGVFLNATDIDSGEFVSATVTRLPSEPGGVLLHWDTASSQYVNVTSVPFPMRPYSAALSSGPNGDGAQLVYAFYGNEAQPLLDKFGTFAVDSFEFTTTDSGNATSSPASAQVHVRVPLSAASSSSGFVPSSPSSDPGHKKYTVYEATMGNVSVYSADLSDRRRSVAVRLVSAPRHGTLLDPATGATLVNGSTLSTRSAWPYSQPLLFTYLGLPHYFNSPLYRYNGSELLFEDENAKGDTTPTSVAGSSVSYYDDDDVDTCQGYGHADTFVFRTELADDASVFSQPSRQAVVVVNVNDAPRLTGPPPGTVLQVEAVGASSSTNNNDASGSGDADTLVVDSIVLTDDDRDVDPIKVQVSCRYGFLTLRTAALDEVDFNSYDMCYGHDDWSCAGDGAGDRSMLFVGQPSAVASALSRITYQSTYNLITDTLSVAIFDGQRPATGPGSGSYEDETDGASTCLEKSDFISESRRAPGPFQSECFTSRLNVSIEVGKFAGSDSTVVTPELTDNTQLGIAAAFFGLLVLCFMLRLLVSRLLGWRLRGIPSDWDSDEEDDEDEESSDDDESEESDESDDDAKGEGEEEEERLTKRARFAARRRRSLSSGADDQRRGSGGGGVFGAVRRFTLGVGGGGVVAGSGSGEERQAAVRPSISLATAIELTEFRKGLEEGAEGEASPLSAQASGEGHTVAARVAAVGGSHEEEDGSDSTSGSGYQFVAADWRRHLDDDGHTYFSHPKSGVCTYAMPWVLTPEDLAASIHEPNDPMFWRAVETGHSRADGRPIIFYYNTVTRQSTFDAPMFATWAPEVDQRESKRRNGRFLGMKRK